MAFPQDPFAKRRDSVRPTIERDTAHDGDGFTKTTPNQVNNEGTVSAYVRSASSSSSITLNTISANIEHQVNDSPTLKRKPSSREDSPMQLHKKVTGTVNGQNSPGSPVTDNPYRRLSPAGAPGGGSSMTPATPRALQTTPGQIINAPLATPPQVQAQGQFFNAPVAPLPQVQTQGQFFNAPVAPLPQVQARARFFFAPLTTTPQIQAHGQFFNAPVAPLPQVQTRGQIINAPLATPQVQAHGQFFNAPVAPLPQIQAGGQFFFAPLTTTPQIQAHGQFFNAPVAPLPQVQTRGQIINAPLATPQVQAHGQFFNAPVAPLPQVQAHGQLFNAPVPTRPQIQARGQVNTAPRVQVTTSPQAQRPRTPDMPTRSLSGLFRQVEEERVRKHKNRDPGRDYALHSPCKGK